MGIGKSLNKIGLTKKVDKMTKKIVFMVVLFVGMANMVSGQVEGRAIGLRLGWGNEISYQHPLSDATRLEVDLGLGGYGDNSRFLLTGVHQWVFDLSALQEGFNWYIGAGGQIGTQRYINKNGEGKTDFAIGVALQGGIEYNFDFPLQLSLDYRPSWFFLPSSGGDYSGVMLGVRYKF